LATPQRDRARPYRLGRGAAMWRRIRPMPARRLPSL